MVARLRRAGHSVPVTTRTHERALNVAAETGAQAVNSPREAAASVGIVIVPLSDGRTVRKVYDGPSSSPS
jgi:3-hydroxyisobutyrate dehydrogenase-like beta-hydroxyacid dehydrogenase